jgi:HK97 family phage portal protein
VKNPFRRRTEQRSLDVPWNVGAPLVSAFDVSLDRALQLGPVYAAGRLVASSVASLPIQQYQQRGEARQKMFPSELFRRPSTIGTRYDWIFRSVTSLMYRGNAVGLVTARDPDEYVTAAEWLNPDEIQVLDSQMSGPGSFTHPEWYWRGRRMDPANLIHIPWLVVPGRVWGLSPLGAYAATIGVGLSAQQFSNDWFAGGGVPPGTFKNEQQTVDQLEAQVMKKRLGQAIRSREPIVYGRDWTYTPIAVSPHEAQFVETMRLTASQIAAIYGIPPEMIGGETGGNLSYSSPEQREIEFVQFSLLQWLVKLESHFSALLPPGQYVKFNVDSLIRTDVATRYSSYQTARMIGMLSIDEIRALEDMPPLPGGAGQDYTPLAVKQLAAAGPQLRDAEFDGDGDLAVITDDEVRQALDEARYDTSPLGAGKNWVSGVGGLPAFIRAIAHALMRTGHDESQAIQMAVGVVKNWASGQGNVTAKTRAKAAAAVAEWEAKKAASHAKTAAK